MHSVRDAQSLKQYSGLSVTVYICSLLWSSVRFDLIWQAVKTVIPIILFMGNYSFT